MTEMVQRKAKKIVIFNKKDHDIDLDEFVKEHQSLLVFGCNTSTSMASKVLSLVALDNINSLNPFDPTLQSCTGSSPDHQSFEEYHQHGDPGLCSFIL